MQIISASLVSRLADLLDFSSAVDVTLSDKSRELNARQKRMMEDQFDLLFQRYEKVRPYDVDARVLNLRAEKELARRKIATAREMERRSFRAAKRAEQQLLEASMKAEGVLA